MGRSIGTQQILHSNATDIVESEHTVILQDGIVRGVAALQPQKPG